MQSRTSGPGLTRRADRRLPGATRGSLFLGLLTAAALAVTGVLAVPPQARAAPSGPRQSAPCVLLGSANVGGIGSDPIEEFDACMLFHCYQRFTNADGTSGCAYGRGGSVTLGCATSARAARAYVRKTLRRGFRRVDVGADLAGILADASQAFVYLAVGTADVRFTLGAASDNDPNPTWPGVKREATVGARNIAHALKGRHLRKVIC